MSTDNWIGYAGKLFRAALLWLLDGAAVLGLSRGSSNRIVFVRVDAIGDFILWYGCIEATRSHFGNSPSVLICNKAVLELATSCGGFDEVIPVDIEALIHDLPYRLRFLRSVRRLRAAVAVQPTFSRVFLTGDAIVRATGAATRIGSIGDLSGMRPWQRWIANGAYSHLVPALQKPMMELERNCEFLRELGMDSASPEIARLPRVAEVPKALELRRDYFVVFPGAGSANRIWPPQRYAEVARVVERLYGWQLVVCGTALENTLACAVIEHSGITDAVNLAGKTTLLEFVELIRGARLLIGNETSALHIAAAVDTPCVGLVGGGHFGRFVPYSPSVRGTVPVPVVQPMECFGCNWSCVKDYKSGSAFPCIAAIGVPAVLDAIQRAIEHEEDPRAGAE